MSKTIEEKIAEIIDKITCRLFGHLPTNLKKSFEFGDGSNSYTAKCFRCKSELMGLESKGKHSGKWIWSWVTVNKKLIKK